MLGDISTCIKPSPVSINLYIHGLAQLTADMCLHLRAYMSTDIRTDICYICTNICTGMCTCIHIYACMHACIHTYILMHVYIHMHIPAPIQKVRTCTCASAAMGITRMPEIGCNSAFHQGPAFCGWVHAMCPSSFIFTAPKPNS